MLKKNTTELSNIQFSWVVRVFLVAISECSGYQFKHNEHDNLTEALKKIQNNLNVIILKKNEMFDVDINVMIGL